MSKLGFLFLSLLFGLSFTVQAKDLVEEALSEVRAVKADLYSLESSVLGELPGPAERAAHQMRCRPRIDIKPGASLTLKIDAAIRAKIKELKLEEFKNGRHRTAVPLGIAGARLVDLQKRAEFLVGWTVPDTPAHGVLLKDDFVIGANGRLFEDTGDPRPELGYALADSQCPALKGVVTLHVVRKGELLNLEIDLGSTLAYSDTWPFNCEKNKQVRAAALRFVINSHPWFRYNYWNGLFLMASGDDEAMDLARRHLCAGLPDKIERENTGAHVWNNGYELITLCEYYFLTGDSRLLPTIRSKAEGLAWAQYRSGSWTHGGGKGPATLAPGMGSGGYGELNNAGLAAFNGLCLARQCGIEPYDHTIPRSIRFFGSFCGANIGYGLGTPELRTGRMDNGLSSEAAVAFHILGEDEMAGRWARSVCYMWMGRERGHAEAIFSPAWGAIGASYAPKEEFQMFMQQMLWAYELGRRRDGSLAFLRGTRWHRPSETAAMALFMYLPERRLQIMGAPKSVFAVKPPKGLEKAAQLYKEKKWAALRAELGSMWVSVCVGM